MQQVAYGLWKSPITPGQLSTSLRLSEPCWDTDGKSLGWIEGRSDRGVLVVQRAGDAPRDLTADASVRAFVGYGGGDFTLAEGVAYFVAQKDQRIYRQPLKGGAARPITPEFGASCSPTVSPDGRYVAYVHTYEGIDCIAMVDGAGESWPSRLETGRDFYMQPTWSPDGKYLAWVEWDFPNMPWDGSELRVARLQLDSGARPSIKMSSVVAGGNEVSIFQPAFGRDGSLWFVSDESGVGQIYRSETPGATAEMVTDGTGEYSRPAWAHGQRTFGPVPGGGAVAVRSEGGFERLISIGRRGLGQGPLDDYSAIANPTVSPDGSEVAFVGTSGTVPPRVVVSRIDDESVKVIRYSDSEAIAEGALARPRNVSWESFDGELAHGIYYPPAGGISSEMGPPPLVVIVHGGPTSQTVASFSAQAQFLATRGYGVLLPNYRGSTGYGRDYMLKLRGNWGIYDIEDSKSGASHLVSSGEVDGSRLVIMGGSAGGFTCLQSLVLHPGFYCAGVCLFGVSNMFTLASDTHKFEARYLDQLLGPLPDASDVYRERSPIFHADKIVDPLAVFHGDIDRVVPHAQSDSIVASLRARGVPHAYHVYPGEGHGWQIGRAHV